MIPIKQPKSINFKCSNNKYRNKCKIDKYFSMPSGLQASSSILFVSNFPKPTSVKELHTIFDVFGRVIAINIIPKSDYAFAFVEYDDMRDAVDAQKGLDKSSFRGRKLKVEFKNTKPVYTKATLESEQPKLKEQHKNKPGSSDMSPENNHKVQKVRETSRECSRSREKHRGKHTSHHLSSSDSMRSKSSSHDRYQHLYDQIKILSRHIQRLQARLHRLQHKNK